MPTVVDQHVDFSISRAGGRHELAVLVSMVSDLVRKEAAGDLHRIFTDVRLPTARPLSRSLSDSAIKTPSRDAPGG